MASQLGSVVVLGLLLVVGCAATSSVGQSSSTTPTHFDVTSLNRSSFPVGFTFGTASSSYQVILSKFTNVSCYIVYVFYIYINFLFILNLILLSIYVEIYKFKYNNFMLMCHTEIY